MTLNKAIKMLEKKKSIIGGVLIAVGTVVTLPASLPAWTASALIYAGTALGGAGVFDKLRRASEK